jgi:hypothetical protein
MAIHSVRHNANADTNADANTNADPNTDADTDADPNTNTNTDTNANADTTAIATRFNWPRSRSGRELTLHAPSERSVPGL